MKIRSILLVAIGTALLCAVSCKKDKGFSGTSVELGLSIKWATMNVDAASKDAIGTTMTYTEAVEYAKQSKKWSLPTAVQWAELMTSGKVNISWVNEPKGFVAIAEDGAQVFFPAGKYLVGDLSEGQVGYVDMSTSTKPTSITWVGNTEGTYCIRLVRK